MKTIIVYVTPIKYLFIVFSDATSGYCNGSFEAGL